MDDPVNGRTLFYRVGEAEKDILAVNKRIDDLATSFGAKLDRNTAWAIGLAFSIAASSVILALSIALTVLLATRG